jgi:UDP-N-acetyl-2-amino-2-deoxyglucuronate dehydrogenase
MKSRFAVVGMGFIYPRHKQAIENLGGEVYLTCDIDKKKKPDFTDWAEMFNSPKFDDVQYVSICAPNYLHSVVAREALLRGKKVLCEKPLSVNGVQGLDGVKTVLQLRYHPELQKISKPKNLYVEAKMFRDDKYWKSWKGNDVMSGGILYNLGVHYIDLAIFLLGDTWEIESVQKTRKKVVAKVRFGESYASFHIEIVKNRKKQGRRLFADGKEITLSNADNLSYEDLHKEVYKEFIAGRGIGLDESQKSLKLIKAILNYV